MNIDISPLTQTIAEGLVTIGVTLIGVGVWYLKKYVASKIESEELKNSLTLTLTTIENAVKASVLDMGEEVKKMLADGKLDASELARLKDMAKSEVYTQISPALQSRLQAHINDVDAFIDKKVKAEVQKLSSTVSSTNN